MRDFGFARWRTTRHSDILFFSFCFFSIIRRNRSERHSPFYSQVRKKKNKKQALHEWKLLLSEKTFLLHLVVTNLLIIQQLIESISIKPILMWSSEDCAEVIDANETWNSVVVLLSVWSVRGDEGCTWGQAMCRSSWCPGQTKELFGRTQDNRWDRYYERETRYGDLWIFLHSSGNYLHGLYCWIMAMAIPLANLSEKDIAP